MTVQVNITGNLVMQEALVDRRIAAVSYLREHDPFLNRKPTFSLGNPITVLRLSGLALIR